MGYEWGFGFFSGCGSYFDNLLFCCGWVEIGMFMSVMWL